MEIKLLDIKSGAPSSSTVEVKDKVFADRLRGDLIHQVVQAYRARARSGSKAQKSRSEVRGGGVKPWRQKGTGRARAGTIRSPIWRGGGVTFAAKPRDFSQKVNKKMYCVAVRSILSELVRQERLLVATDFAVTSNKTRDLAKKLRDLNMVNVLVVTDNLDPNLHLASRNLYTIGVCVVDEINPVDLISFDKVLFTVPALKKIEERLS